MAGERKGRRRRTTADIVGDAQRGADALRSLADGGDTPVRFDGARGLTYETTERLPNGRTYAFRALVEGSEGGPIITGLVISAPEGIDTAVLRSIKPADVVQMVGRASERALREWAATADTEQARNARDAIATADATKPHRGRPRLTDTFLHEVAEEYLSTFDELRGTGRNVMATIAERRFVESVKTVETWVRRAASAGFLTPAVKGRAGRLPGPRLYEATKETSE